MANAAASNVTVLDSYSQGGLNSKRTVVKLCRITGGTFGGGTNKIPASAFGLAQLTGCGNAVQSNSAKVYLAAIAYGGTHVLLTDPTQATDASRVPADVNLSSETLELEVKGIE